MRLPIFLLVVGLTMINPFSAPAQEWTRFHGPNGQGVNETVDIPSEFTPDDFNWKTKLPGIGHSCPVLWGERVFLLSADPETAERYMLCINAADGEIIWNRNYPSTPHHLHSRSSFASCTPAVDAKQVYVAWSTPKQTTLKSFSHDGQELWSKNLGPWVSQHGFGTSPILYHDLVILSNSQQAARLKEGQKPGKSFLMAFNRTTGDLVWSTPRASVNVCYSAPCIYRSPGRADQIINTSTGDGIYSVDPKTGEQNWQIKVFRMRTVSSPVLAGGLIFGSTGSGGGGNYVVAIKPGETPEEVYRVTTQAPYVPTSVAKGDLLFLWYDKGIVTCIDAPTGKVHWRKRLGGGFSASPVRAANKIFCVSDDGVVHVLAAEKEFKLLGKNPLGEDSRSTPAIAGGRMYFRTYSHLISVGGKSE